MASRPYPAEESTNPISELFRQHRGIILFAPLLIAAVVAAFTGYYIIQPEEEGVGQTG